MVFGWSLTGIQIVPSGAESYRVEKNSISAPTAVVATAGTTPDTWDPPGSAGVSGDSRIRLLVLWFQVCKRAATAS